MNVWGETGSGEYEITVASLATYRNEKGYPFCPGCGHGGILDALNQALVTLQLDPTTTVIVSDIGCVGLSDQYFQVNAFHGLHGRSLTYATGIKLARPDLKVIVVMGDGGCGIGGAHLLNAARRNIGITTLVFNNLNFGMTGGQHSVTTPEHGITTTTLAGNLERPLDLCATVGVNGAAYAYRGTVFDRDLPDRIAEAINCEGFALLDIWELCTAYYVPNNVFSKKALLETMQGLGLRTGVLYRDERPEYAAACRAASVPGKPSPAALTSRFPALLDRRTDVVVAGAAGGRVRSAARLAASAAVLSGLYAAQRDDYPVTVKTGHSLSELMLSPAPIDYTGISKPDALIVVTPEGYRRAARALHSMTPRDRVFLSPEFAGAHTLARKTIFDPKTAGVSLTRGNAALALLSAALVKLGALSPEALLAAADADEPARAADNRKTVEIGIRLANESGNSPF